MREFTTSGQAWLCASQWRVPAVRHDHPTLRSGRWAFRFVLRIGLLILCLMVLSSCKPSDTRDTLPGPPPWAAELGAPPSERAVIAVPGRVRIVLDKGLWHREFRADSRKEVPLGIQRLKPSPELMQVFRWYRLLRVWRSMSQLERPFDGRMRVIGYAEWIKLRRQERGMRKNARPYKPPRLPLAPATFELKFPDETDVDAVVKALKKVAGVILAEVVVAPIPQAPYIPNDPGWLDPADANYSEILARGRWGFHNTGATLDTGYLDDFDVDAPEAWEFQRGDPNVVVAVLDNGVDVTHEDLYLNIYLNNGEVPTNVVTNYRGASPDDGLANELTFYDLNMPAVVSALAAQGWTNTNNTPYIDGEDVISWWGDCPANGNDGVNCIDNDGNGYVDDLVGWDFATGDNLPFQIGKGDHGTPVSGLIAAIADNGVGISGIAPRVRILPVGSVFSLSEILYILDFLPVRVINHSMSWVFSGGLPADVQAVFANLEPEGVLYVASLGNLNVFTYGSDPSRREAVVSVSNFENDGTRNNSGGSGYGPKTDVAAPGTGLYTLSPRTAGGPGGTEWFGGTSAASPVTAGVAALIASENPALTPEQIRQVLRMTAVDPTSVADDRGENTPGWDLYSGWGLINAGNAIAGLRNGDVYPEANILSLFVNYRNSHRGDVFSIQNGTKDILAYLGLPGGGLVNWTLRRSTAWDLSGAVMMASGNGVAYSGGAAPIHTVNTDQLNNGKNVLELEVVTTLGVTAKDRAVIDLPRAYIANLKEGQQIIHNIPLTGFAYGPGFTRYRILVAPGWTPAATDFTEIHTSTTEHRPVLPGVPGGAYTEDRTLLSELDIFALTFSGEATIRLVTEGSSQWTFDEKVIIDNVQPPQQSGFPIKTNFYSDAGAPLAVDIDGDGKLELVLSCNFFDPSVGWDRGTIWALRSNGSAVPGWPVSLPTGEYLYQPVSAGDIDGDGRPEVVARTRSAQDAESVRLFNHDGSEILAGWPITFDYRLPSVYARWDDHAPVLADVTSDGRPEILVAVSKSDPDVPNPVIRAYTIDGTVAQTYETNPGPVFVSQPVVGDIDGDGEINIVAVAYSYSIASSPFTLYVWRRDGTVAWTAEIRGESNDIAHSPMLMDVDNDGILEIITAVTGRDSKIYDGDGTLLASGGAIGRGPRIAGAQFQPGVPTDEKGVVVGHRIGLSSSDVGANLEVISPQTGNLLPGWPGRVRIANGEVDHQPLVADLRGDATLEIAVSNSPPPAFYDGPALEYQLAVLDNSGNIVADGDRFPLYYPSAVAAEPLVVDLDGDNDLELVVQTDPPDSQVYVYDLDVAKGPGRVAWGEFAHDPSRSGNYHGGLNILSPTTARSEAAGPFDDSANQALVLVRTRFNRGLPVGAENPTKWKVAIGGQAAGIREVALVQGEIWLLVEPVAQPAAGSYMLRVEFDDGGIAHWDAYKDAVLYEPAVQHHTQIGVIDRSGSMNSSQKIESARVAARFFAESAYPGDEVGVVSYNTAASDDLGSGVLTAGPNRDQIANAITNVSTGGRTSIGAGIAKGLEILRNNATDANLWGMVLLSDGLENEEPFWSRAGSPPPVRPDVQVMMTDRPEFAIHTVALGPGADQALLQEIADFTGGTFYPVYLGESISLFNRLADVYHFARERIDRTQRILTHAADLAPESSWQGSLEVPQGTRRLQFGLNWDKPYLIRRKERPPVNLEIQRPNGATVVLTDPGVTFTSNRTDAITTVAAPEPGTWQVRLISVTEAETAEAMLAVSANTPVQVQVSISGIDAFRGISIPTLVAFAKDRKGFVRESKFAITITAPDKTRSSVVLRDDGRHRDGGPGDGIFGGQVTLNQPGSYLITVASKGNSSAGPYSITQTTGIYNQASTDMDRDGIPDKWERKYAPECKDWLHPRGDTDKDGLDNLSEWRFGTNPLRADTDGDGRSDGEEYGKGTDPTDRGF